MIMLVFLGACASSSQEVTTIPTGNTPVNADANNNEQVPSVVDAPQEVVSEVKEFKIIATDFSFSPDTIRVQEGDKVRLVITSDDGEHGLAVREFGVNIKVAEGETGSAEFVADKKGMFTFYCSVYCGAGHKEMTGVLIVE
ncbi:MAG TPA: cupredoxin domain-containing protein [Candidatus Nanoarchaeia archaeon]|nr:cupredoxin domain-containing protein [Candidatus Nanoarchaeia archaeon]